MGDPVSLAGTAVGIVSLGLSVCQGLVSYYSTFRDYSKDTKNILQKLEGLKDVLQVLEEFFQNYDDLQPETKAVKTAKRNILACKDGLKQLEDIMGKCKAVSISVKPERDFLNRALYPFRRDTIKAVLEHIESLQSNLDTSIDVLQLFISSQDSERTTTLCVATKQIVTESTRIHSHVKNIDQTQQSIDLRISGIEEQLGDMSLQLSRQNIPMNDLRGPGPIRDNHEVLHHDTVSLIDTSGMPNYRPRRQKCSCSSLSVSSTRRKEPPLVSLWRSSHRFGCPLYFHEEKSIFKTRMNFKNRLFSTSIRVCLNSIREAGGYTIFPSLSFCPIVEELESPAFELVWGTRYKLMQDKSASPALIRNLINQLRSIYEEGSGSPKDVSAWGDNILHKVLGLMRYVPESMIADYRDLVRRLIEFGVPLNEKGEFSRGALNTLLIEGSHNFNNASEFTQDQMVFMASDLVASSADLTQSINETSGLMFYYRGPNRSVHAIHCSAEYLNAIMRRNIVHDEFYSSDPEKYILSRSEGDLQKILSISTDRGVSVDGTYLAEMCIGWPAGLRIIMKAGYRLQRKELLLKALRSNCFESAHLLLTGDDPLIDTSHVYMAYRTGNSGIFKMVVHALVERRRKLQKLAERHLPVHIQDQLGLPKQGVLDSQASQVYLKLKQFDIDYDPGLSPSSSEPDTVYSCIDYDINATKTLYDAGFQNLEEETTDWTGENKGFTILMQLSRVASWRNDRPGGLEKVLETLQFLTGKGADPHRRQHEDGRTAMHFLGPSISLIFQSCVCNEIQPEGLYFIQWVEISPSRSLGAIIRVLDREWSPLKHNSWSLLENLFMDRHNDACSCACSAQGCLPSTTFFRNLMKKAGLFPKVQAMAEVIRFLGERGGARSMEAWNDALAPIVIRICVFEYLELTHLCCAEINKYDDPKPQYWVLRDEMEFIRDEEQSLIEEVGDLTAFFLSKYHEMEMGLPQFLLEYWWIEIRKNPKPDDEKGKLEYEKEIEQIRSTGVILDESCT